MKNAIKSVVLILTALLAVDGCSNPFAPKKQPGNPEDEQPNPPATTPLQWMDNLRSAMRRRNAEDYEVLLDQDFWFTETDCQGDLVLANGLEEELEIMAGSRDGSHQGIFDIFRTFNFDFTPVGAPTSELGSEHPEAYPGDPDGHPDEDWEVFRGRVQMLLLDEDDNGFSVDQVMTYKLRLSEDGTYKVIRWVDDPMSGNCESGSEKPLAGPASWAAVKQHLR